MVLNNEHSHLESLLDDAQAYLDAGEIDRAIVALREAYKVDHRNLRACCLLGFCAIHRGKLDDAKKYFSFVLRIDPDNASARTGLKHATDHLAEPLAHPREAQVERPLPPPVPAGPPEEDQSKLGFSKRLGVYASTIFAAALVGVGISSICLEFFFGTLLPAITGFRHWESRADDVFGYFFALLVLCVSIFFGTKIARSRLARHTEGKAGKSARPVGQAAKQPMHNQAVASQKPSTVKLVIAGLLWLPLLALGGYLGGLIGNEISRGGGAILGAIVGIVILQTIYAAIFPRRR
jgi:hypothetical protein